MAYCMSMPALCTTGLRDTSSPVFTRRRGNLKIIDGTGRLFGKINIIDFFVILCLISFLAVSLFWYTLSANEKNMLDKRWISVQVRFLEIDPGFNKMIKQGDCEKDLFGKIVGNIVNIVSTKPSKVWVVIDNKMFSTIDHPEKTDLIVDVKLLCTMRDGAYYYKTFPIKVGNNIVFTTDIYTIQGLIVNLEIGS